MKEILIITSYFPPETGAASNRIFHLADGLKQRSFKISVLTPLPNYPKGKIFKQYRRNVHHKTVQNDITIHRLWIFATVLKNTLVRLFAMLSYSCSLILYFIFHNIPTTVIVQSPPLLVAFTCCLFLRSKKRQLILNVSDLWPLAGLELGALKKNFSYKMLERIERFNYRKADLVLGQSDEILTHIKKIYPHKATFLYRNFPDFPPPKACDISKSSSSKIKLVYAGLLGIAQGILQLCQRLKYDAIEFHIYGAGAEQEMIKKYISAHPELPIVYHGEVTRTFLHQQLLNYDLGIIPLRSRIYGSVPSKIFEYAALGLPMLYYGGGEGETLVLKHHLGWVARAGDYTQLNEMLSSLTKDDFNDNLKETIRAASKSHFDFQKQLNQLEKML